MKNLTAIIGGTCLVVSSFGLYAQTVPAPTVAKPMTLRDRYLELKSKTETFEDYKVIKEWMLDREWKVIGDSIRAGRVALAEAQTAVDRLESELQKARAALKESEESIAPLEHEGAHIDFIGIDFHKSAFIGLVLVVFAGLLTLSAVIGLRLRVVQSVLQDRSEVISTLNQEFEEYKHKALEKQTKLSRELQTERNKVLEVRKV